MKTQWVIKDWADNLIQLEGRPTHFDSFEDAEGCLSEHLDDEYETDRQEYEIEPVEGY